MNSQTEQLFPTISIEVNQVLRGLGSTNSRPAEHHLVSVEHDSVNLLVLNDNPVGDKKSYITKNNLGDEVQVHEEIVTHSGLDLPFREGLIGRRVNFEYFKNPIKGFLLACMGEDVEHAYVACNYGDIIHTTALIPIPDIVSIELRPTAERDYLARYYYDFDLQSIYSIPILLENDEVVASRELNLNDVENVREELANLEGEEIYKRQ